MWRPLALLAACFEVSRSLPPASTHAGPLEGNVRWRHLYSRGGQFPSINSDGRVAGVRTRSMKSLLEITSVSVGTVAIKGGHSSRYLCMEDEGRLQGLLVYSRENCSLVERINENHYNTYKSTKYGTLVSLSSSRQSQMSEEEDLLADLLPLAS